MIKVHREERLSILSQHHEQIPHYFRRVKEMLGKISRYRSPLHMERKYWSCQTMRWAEKRQREKDRIIEQNMKIIAKIESAKAKISTRPLPSISFNTMKSKTRNLQFSNSQNKIRPKIKDLFRNQQQILEENQQLTHSLMTVRSKIQCWTSKKIRSVQQTLAQRKREQDKKVVDKLKQISQQFAKIKALTSQNRESSAASISNNSTQGYR